MTHKHFTCLYNYTFSSLVLLLDDVCLYLLSSISINFNKPKSILPNVRISQFS